MKIEIADQLTGEQEAAITALQRIVFSTVSDEEGKEDFYHPASIQVLAYVVDVLVGWAGVYISQVEFEGKQITLGGYGIGVYPDYRRKGIAREMATEAMEYLKKKNVDVGFLSVDLSNTVTIALHEKQRFVMLPRDFSWTNAKGELKRSDGGMITPISSEELFEYVLNGSDDLYVGEGYW